MKSILADFKTFALRGNIVDLAVAVIIGTAFGNIVSSFVDNIVTPILGLLLGGVDFTGMSLTLGASTITYGAFLQSVFDFTLIAFAIFLALKALVRLHLKADKIPEEPKAPTEEVLLLREIRDAVKG